MRIIKYRDEYAHNITPYRSNSHPTVQNGVTSFQGCLTMIKRLNDLVDDINSDLEKTVGLIDNQSSYK